MKTIPTMRIWRPGFLLVVLSFLPLHTHAAEPAGGEQEAPAAMPQAKRKHHAKPRTLEQLVTQPAEIEEPPAMLQKEAPAGEGTPCQSDPAELQILLALRERRLELDGRERTVQAREAEFKQAQKKIDDRVEQLNQSVARLEARLELGEPGRQARDARVKTLVDSISTLSAKKAAPILAETEPTLVAELMQRLGTTRTAALLAVMPTVKAARIVNITGGPRQAGTRNAPPAAASAQAAPPPVKQDKPSTEASGKAPEAAAANSDTAPTPADAAAQAEPEKKP